MVEIIESWLLFKIFFLYLIFNKLEIIYSSKIYDLDILKLVSFQLSNQKNTLFFTNILFLHNFKKKMELFYV